MEAGSPVRPGGLLGINIQVNPSGLTGPLPGGGWRNHIPGEGPRGRWRVCREGRGRRRREGPATCHPHRPSSPPPTSAPGRWSYKYHLCQCAEHLLQATRCSRGWEDSRERHEASASRSLHTGGREATSTSTNKKYFWKVDKGLKKIKQSLNRKWATGKAMGDGLSGKPARR